MTTPNPEWIQSINEKLDRADKENESRYWSKVCIYRAPTQYKKSVGVDGLFAPSVVSIGPYHHRNKRLSNMKSHKWRSFKLMLRRTGHDKIIYFNKVMANQDQIWACYEWPTGTGFGSKDFVEMIVLDGCFILEFLRGVETGFEELGYAKDDPIFTTQDVMMLQALQRDLLMLENQLPLFVLNLLLEIQIADPVKWNVLPPLILNFFAPLTPTGEALVSSLVYTNTYDHDNPLHCLDVVREVLLRPSESHPEANLQKKNRSRSNHKCGKMKMHCVTELKKGGIRFRSRETDRFWDVKFQNGILEIPTLVINDATMSLFANLIAFELRNPNCEKDIISYVIFMDHLINSPEDVAYLHYCGIIEHYLGSDAEVADLFNGLCREVVFDPSKSYLSDISDGVNKYFNRKWNSWWATLKHNYFSSPWAIISLFAAVMLLVLTFLQTHYTIYGYYWPRK